MNNAELLIEELIRKSLVFRIMVLLAKHRELTTSELKALLDYRYSDSTIRRALNYLERVGLIKKSNNGRDNIITLSENEFTVKLAKFINTLHEKNLWDVFERTLLGTKSRMKAIIALMRGPMTKTDLSKECNTINGAPTELMLKPLISHGLIIEYRGRRRVEYELNKNHPLNQVLMEFLREIGGVDNNNRKNKENYAKLAKAIVNYILRHWDDYVVNIHHRDTIKLTGPTIKSLATQIAERRGWRITRLSWLVDFVIEEFKKRGFCVMVKKNGQRPNITKVKVYVSKTCDGEQT